MFTVVLTPQLVTSFGGNETWLAQTIAGLSGWLGWVLPLLVAEWWLVEADRGCGEPGSAPSARADRHGLDDHVRERAVGAVARDLRDAVDDVLPFEHVAEHRDIVGRAAGATTRSRGS